MKRTIALVLSLLMLLVLVPTTALADTDVHARLEVTLNPSAQTLFTYGSDLVFNWQDADLVVKLFDTTSANTDGTTLALASAVAAGKYVIMMNDDTVYNPTVGSQYPFVATDLGSKTLKVKCTYTPTDNTHTTTVTADVTISVQNNVLSNIEVTTDPIQKEYYVGEYISLSGAVVKARYTNMTDQVTLASDGYTVTSTKAAGADPIAVSAPLTALYTNLRFSRTETYAGSKTEKTFFDDVPITVTAAASALTLKDGGSEIIAPISMTPLSATKTITADVGTGPKASLVANVSNPAVVAIDTTQLTSFGTFTITPLSVGTAVVTVRTRGSNITKTIAIEVTAAPVLAGGIILDKSTVKLPVNSPYALIATITPDNTSNKTIVWTSSSPSNVSVDSTGTVKVLRDFSADAADGVAITTSGGVNYVTITATATNGDTIPANDKTFTCTVSVNTILVDGIAISDTSITLNKLSWKKLSAVTTPTNAANPAVTWSTSNPLVATVDSTGKVKAEGIPAGADYGEAIITAQTSNPSVYATCTVKVVAAILTTSLTLNKSEVSLNVGDEETLAVSGLPTNATNKTLVWTSSNPEVASVTSAGKVIGASKGTAVIRADSTDGSGEVRLLCGHGQQHPDSQRLPRQVFPRPE